MSRHPEATYLEHMRDYASETMHFCQGRVRADLDSDRMLMAMWFTVTGTSDPDLARSCGPELCHRRRCPTSQPRRLSAE